MAKQNKDAIIREHPIMFPTGLRIGSSKENSIIILDFLDGETDKIYSSLALTISMIKELQVALTSFLDNEKPSK